MTIFADFAFGGGLGICAAIWVIGIIDRNYLLAAICGSGAAIAGAIVLNHTL